MTRVAADAVLDQLVAGDAGLDQLVATDAVLALVVDLVEVADQGDKPRYSDRRSSERFRGAEKPVEKSVNVLEPCHTSLYDDYS